MKLPYTILAVLSAILFSAVSCVKEVNIDEQGEGEEVTILISTGDRQAQTRTPVDPTEQGDDPDYRIGTLRVLIYHESNGLLYKKTEKFTPPDNPQSIILKTGRYNFVFIANEHLDGTLSTALETLAEGSSFSEIATLKIDGVALNSKIMTGVPASGETDTFIPKVAMKGNVQVSKRDGETMIVESDGTTINNSTDNWVVAMTQTGIRIDLSLELTASQMALYNEDKLTLSFDNIPDRVDLLGKYNYTGTAQTITRVLKSGTVSGNTVTWSRIILPETFFSDRSNKENGIVLTASFDGTDYTATLGYDLTSDPKDYTLPRNTYLDITATVNSQQQALDCSATVVDWERPAQNVIADGQYYLYVAADELLFTDAEGSAEITAETNYDLTEDKQGYPKKIQVSKEDGSNWITDLEAETNDSKNYKIKFQVAEFGNAPVRTAPFRTAKIKVTAGNMTKVINVTQALWGGHADILYFDPDDDYRLKIAQWDTSELDKDNYQTRMIFTKFGGVVGFTIEGTTWDNQYIKFNPSIYNVGTDITDFGPNFDNPATSNAPPYIPGFVSEDYSTDNIHNISSTDYHKLENIKIGRGDICQLLGLTAEQIKGAATQAAFDALLAGRSAEYQGWRLPTARENASFVGGASNYSNWISWENGDPIYAYHSTTNADPDFMKWPYYYNNAGTAVGVDKSTGAAGIPNTGRFPVVNDPYNDEYSQVLPAAGYRFSYGGEAFDAGLYGVFWSSTPANAEFGHALPLFYWPVSPVTSSYYRAGYAVRCVRPPMNNHLKY